MLLSEADDAKFEAEFGHAPKDACSALSLRLQAYKVDVGAVGPSAVTAAAEFLPCKRDGKSIRDYVRALAEHVKGNLFEWIVSPKCGTCGLECGGALSYGVPTEEELAKGRVRRVEVWECKNGECKGSGRFPRYRYADSVLLRSRKGRCGEWAKAFWLLCRAAEGVDARLVYDFTDHVWGEVRDSGGGEWVHVDVCETAVDKRLMYERDWKKQLTWIFAISSDGRIDDVTKSYTQDYDTVLKRREQKGVGEAWLAAEIRRINCAAPPEQRDAQ